MHSSTKHELFTGAHYLLIGFIAHAATMRWFTHRHAVVQMFIWLGIASVLSLVRALVLFLSSWFARPEGLTIGRRNW